MKDVFLSHASKDKELIVRPFANRLGAIGITYWLDEAEIKWGDKLGKSINHGLADSNYVVVFLTENFIGRNWTEAELSSSLTRENSEGRTIVLPIVVGDPQEILAPYPLLKDKIYKKWSDGIDSCVDSLRDVILSSKEGKLVATTVSGTGHVVDVDAGLVIRLLGKMDSHSVYPPKYFVEGLAGSGLLVDVSDDGKSIVINGTSIPETTPDFGLPGIWSLHVAQQCWNLLIKKPFKSPFLGRGRIYRHMVASLRHHLLGLGMPEEFKAMGSG